MCLLHIRLTFLEYLGGATNMEFLLDQNSNLATRDLIVDASFLFTSSNVFLSITEAATASLLEHVQIAAETKA